MNVAVPMSHRQQASEDFRGLSEGLIRALGIVKQARDDADQKKRQELQDKVTQQQIQANDFSLGQKQAEQSLVQQFSDKVTRDATPGAFGPALPGEQNALPTPFTNQSNSDAFKANIIKQLRVMRGQDPGDPMAEMAAQKAQNDKMIGDAAAAPELRKLDIAKGNATVENLKASTEETKKRTELLGQPKPPDPKDALEVAKFSRQLKQDFMGSQLTKDFQIIERTKDQMKNSLDAWKKRAEAAAKEGKTLDKGGIDQTLITLFNKLLDPSSVVRESEYARTPEGMAFLDRMTGQWEKFKAGGAGISDSFRDEIIASADTLLKAAEQGFAKHAQDAIADAQSYGIDPARVVGGYARYQDWASPGGNGGGAGPIQIGGADDYAKLAPGTLYIDPNGVQRRKK